MENCEKSCASKVVNCEKDTDCESCEKCDNKICKSTCSINEICNNGKCETPLPSAKQTCVSSPLPPYDKNSESNGIYKNVNSNIFKTATETVPVDHAGMGLGNLQSNWIGCFTHAGGVTANNQYAQPKTQSGADGDNWGGGSMWWGRFSNTPKKGSQIYPFPIYYYARFLGALYGDTGIYDSISVDNWNVCTITDIKTDGSAPTQKAIQCINEKIIQPAIDKAKYATIQAVKEISEQNQNDIVKDIYKQDQTLNNIFVDLYTTPSSENSKIIGINPSANSANALYKYYSTTSKDDLNEITESYKKAIKSCPVKSPTGTWLKLVDIAKAWILSVGGVKSELKNLYKQRIRDCPAALIIVPGETMCKGKGGDINSMECENVASGVWQVTSPDGTPISSGCANLDDPTQRLNCLKNAVCNTTEINNNVCCQADYVNTHLYNSQSWNIASLGMFNEGYGTCGWSKTDKHFCMNNTSIPCKLPDSGGGNDSPSGGGTGGGNTGVTGVCKYMGKNPTPEPCNVWNNNQNACNDPNQGGNWDCKYFPKNKLF